MNMYIVSTRKKITSGIGFSDNDYLLQLENGFLQSCSDESFIARIQKKKLLILVHGFNNPFEDVIQEYQLIFNQKESHFPEEYDHIIGFLWPGGESELDYFHAKKMAEKTGPRLSQWLSLFLRPTVK
jgi:esterase/lipase superfamily enzyme